MKEWEITLDQYGKVIRENASWEAQMQFAQAERLEGIYEVLTKIAEGGDKITLGPITMTAPEWLAQINRKFDQVDLLVSNKFRELLTRVADLEAKIAEQAPAPVAPQEGKFDCRFIKFRTYDIEKNGSPFMSLTIANNIDAEDIPKTIDFILNRLNTKPVESHQAAGDEAKWPEDVVIVDMFGDDYELSHEYTDEIPVHRMRIDKMDDDGNYQNVLIFDSLKSIESIHNFTGQWLRARQGGTV